MPLARPARPILSQFKRGLLLALIPVGLLAWFSLSYGTPDFALQMPGEYEFAPVQPGDVFTLPCLTEIRIEDPEGFEAYSARRPLGGSDAFHPPVGVVWIKRGDMGVRFSSKDCTSGQAKINGAVHSGPVFWVLASGEVVRDGRSGTPVLVKTVDAGAANSASKR